MWAYYRKTAIPIQVVILTASVMLLLIAKLPLPGVVMLLIVMELGAIVGAWWGARLKRKLQGDAERLPLNR